MWKIRLELGYVGSLIPFYVTKNNENGVCGYFN